MLALQFLASNIEMLTLLVQVQSVNCAMGRSGRPQIILFALSSHSLCGWVTKKPYPCFETLSSRPLINEARTFGLDGFQRASFRDIPTCHSDLAKTLFAAAVF